ncbi:MAG: HAD hydrolase family protein [Capsulimonadaceae bacterium]|nr:HAD hydrolase family protein [Capsulimonadaceae bacterium]
MKDVRLLIMDVDGTLTDGGIYIGPAGEEHKRFHIADGLGIRMAHTAGLRTAVITGIVSEPVRVRMESLGSSDILLGIGNKKNAVQSLKEKYGLLDEQVAFIGDDLNDLPAFEAVGVRIAVANAVPQLKQRAHYITTTPGGAGAVREAIEVILTAQDRLARAVDGYVEEITRAR